MTATVQLAAPPHEEALLPVYRRVPLEIARGEGVYVYDPDGRAYLDFVSGIAVNALGYGDEGIRTAIEGALSSGVLHASNQYHTAPARALEQARRLAALCRGYRVPFIVNDRPDIAVLLEADGVHVGQNDLPPDAARRFLAREVRPRLETDPPRSSERMASSG